MAKLESRSQVCSIIKSAHNYQKLLDQLAKLEDSTWGQAAETALHNAQMIGSEIFTAELKRLAAIEPTESSQGKAGWTGDSSGFFARVTAENCGYKA
jgi:hypothetical protein